jgi:hypothetical protein
MARDPLAFDHQRVLANVREATTDDLLNRVTAYRQGMEPEAVDIIEEELHRRGVTTEDIAAHAQRVGEEVIFLEDGIAAKCSRCHAPAVAQGWGWLRLFRRIPFLPRREFYCKEHLP